MTRAELASQLAAQASARLVSEGAAPQPLLLRVIAEMVVEAIAVAARPDRSQRQDGPARCYTCDRQGTNRTGTTCDKCAGEVTAGGNCGL